MLIYSMLLIVLSPEMISMLLTARALPFYYCSSNVSTGGIHCSLSLGEVEGLVRL